MTGRKHIQLTPTIQRPPPTMPLPSGAAASPPSSELKECHGAYEMTDQNIRAYFFPLVRGALTVSFFCLVMFGLAALGAFIVHQLGI
jgi:hypothetical protein